jgi:ABC-2 type transport system permease protein
MTPAVAILSRTMEAALRMPRSVFLGLAVLVPSGIYALVATSFTIERALEAVLVIGTFFLTALFLPAVAIFISASVLGDERRDGTLSFLVLRPISRYSVAATKIGAGVLAAGAINALGALALTATYGLISGSWSLVLPMMIGAVVVTAGYVAVFVPLGYFTDRAVIIGFVFVLIFENGIAGAVPGLSGLSLWRIGYTAFAGLAGLDSSEEVVEAALSGLTPGAGGAILKVGLLLLIAIVFQGWVLRTRDITA